ncbi:hypothetical protein SAMN05421664_3299 [Chryseobacterium soldanellicola]|uniref:Uncharacterized protein n=1 Tax=Chryseobacterium soldanellicola TaxID=311333 RepID=A0A1H1FWR0_9FLAO|nr:hypothetical protein SAMN05421664_3299 [Chryseobacterium soldanellicola]
MASKKVYLKSLESLLGCFTSGHFVAWPLSSLIGLKIKEFGKKRKGIRRYQNLYGRCRITIKVLIKKLLNH